MFSLDFHLNWKYLSTYLLMTKEFFSFCHGYQHASRYSRSQKPSKCGYEYYRFFLCFALLSIFLRSLAHAFFHCLYICCQQVDKTVRKTSLLEAFQFLLAVFDWEYSVDNQIRWQQCANVPAYPPSSSAAATVDGCKFRLSRHLPVSMMEETR